MNFALINVKNRKKEKKPFGIFAVLSKSLQNIGFCTAAAGLKIRASIGDWIARVFGFGSFS